MEIPEFNTLKDLHEYYAIHNDCQLKKTATQPVYEIHIPSSGIVLIGEAPGANEDKEGKPFVGAAGKFLNTMLEGVDMVRSDIYVSNVVKYRPPENRDPTPQEKKSCRVWLNAELLFVKPKVIVPLGRHSLERFVYGVNISSCHGQIFSHPTGIPIFAMYHPAAALYNPNLRDILIKDFAKLKDFLDKGSPEDMIIKQEVLNPDKLSSKVKDELQDLLSL